MESARAEAIRGAELERGLSSLAWSDEQRDAVDGITRAIINKVLHAPLARLREEVDREEGLAHLEAARSLFALDDARAPGSEADRGEEEE